MGYGGLPNAEGVVQLDASCMHGPTKRAGAVGALEGIKTPSEIVRLIMKYTNHIMLVGKDAQRFAVSYGYKVEDLLTPASREAWLHWRANLSSDRQLRRRARQREAGHVHHRHQSDDARQCRRRHSSIVTTSGLAWKVPGRVGDSAIVGAGQYTDNDVGAAGSTGLGECNILAAGGFPTVDNMRRGMHPKDACLATLKRVMAVIPAHWIGANGRPKFQLQYYAVNKAGEYGAAAMTASPFAVCDEKGARSEQCAVLFSLTVVIPSVARDRRRSAGSMPRVARDDMRATCWRATDTTQAYPWRLSYFPYVTASPNDGVMAMGRVVLFRQSRWDDRGRYGRSALEGGYSTKDAWLARARGTFPRLATGWRLQAIAQAGKDAELLPGVLVTEQRRGNR